MLVIFGASIVMAATLADSPFTLGLNSRPSFHPMVNGWHIHLALLNEALLSM